jgi:hypothetical protein
MSPSRVRADVGTGLGGVTGWHICEGSRQLADRLLIRSTRWARPVRRPGDRSEERHAPAARSVASHPDHRTDPDGSPPRTAVTTHSQIRRCPALRPGPFRSVHDLGRFLVGLSGHVQRTGKLFVPVAPSVAPIALDAWHFGALVPVVVTTRTVQGMARARSGQAPAWLLVSDRSARRGLQDQA